MQEEAVGDVAQTLARFIVAGRNRFFAAVAARHHEWNAGPFEQQAMERRVRKHDPQVAEPRRDVRRDRLHPVSADLAPPRGHDRARGGRHELRLPLIQLYVVLRDLERGHHHRQRLGFAVLPFAQACDGSRVGGIHREMEPAKAAHGEDPPSRRSRAACASACSPDTNGGWPPVGSNQSVGPHSAQLFVSE